MKRIPLGKLHYEFDRRAEPRLRIAPGETVVVESEDALSGQIRTNDDRALVARATVTAARPGPADGDWRDPRFLQPTYPV